MGLFNRKNKNVENEPIKHDDSLRDDISKAYDELIANGTEVENSETEPEPEKKNDVDLDMELFKSKVKTFIEKKNQESLTEVIKMLPKRVFLLPSVSNMQEPFEKADGKIKLKQGAVINPALLTAKDKKVFLPIFTDDKSMTQKSPSGIVLKLAFEQCVDIVYNKNNPVCAVVINPFTDNMIIGEDLLRMFFKKKENK